MLGVPANAARKIGSFTIETKITGTTKVEQTFIHAKGKSRASVPAELKSSHPAEVKEVTQFIERESTTLGSGDSVYLDAGIVHASYNDGDETAHLQVVIGPSLGEGGYGLVDVSSDEPWVSLR